jgi:prepilin-type N-terminal cleavage/methylation domain-containing protein
MLALWNRRAPHLRFLNRGFTLIELLAVTAVMVFVTSAILANNSRFGGAVLLQNLAYDMALTVRQAQVYGISVFRFGEEEFSYAYGAHFNPSTPTNFLLFADAVSANGLYDGCSTPSQCELVQSTNISQGYTISDVCVTGSGAETCGHSQIDVTFKRPEPDAYIRADGLSTLYEKGRVVVRSPRGDLRSVVVETNGQISVQ